jgi:hypothetical protein
MQTFKDTATGQFWQFDDDVEASQTNGLWSFIAPHGTVLNVPTTLIPSELPPPSEMPAPVPQFVSRYQGREAMLLTPYGTADDGVSLFDAAVSLLALPDTPAYYVRAWDELQTFERDSPMLTAIADELGLTEEDLDTLFRFASTLRA